MAIILLFLPLLFALIHFLFKGDFAKKTALISSLIVLGCNIVLLTQFDSNHSFNFIEHSPWIHDLGISFDLGIDGLSMLMLLLTNVLVPIIIYSSFGDERKNSSVFYALILLMQFGLNGVFMALDGILFYMFWEITLIPIWLICAFWGAEDRIQITMKFFIYTFFGSLFMLLALIFTYSQTPDHSFALQSLYNANLSGTGLYFVYGSLFLGFAIKMPVFPFHTWQPDTYTTSPTQGTMLLSGIMLKMGIYGVMRWMLPLAPEASPSLAKWLMILSIIGIVYASIIALQKNDIKRIFAYSSIAHVGMIAAGLFSLNIDGWQGATFQMIAHGVNIVGLFFIVHIIEKRIQTRDLTHMGGIAKVAPRFAIFFMIITLGSMAVPLTDGFVGEFLLLKGIYNAHMWAGIIAGTSIILCAVYMLRVYQLSMFGETNSLTSTFTDINMQETIVLAIIAILVLVLGIFPNIIFELVNNSVQSIFQMTL
ncbi:MAG: NADH-quinone oxidoreductase subunit M [Bacteroidota bacterium]